MEHFSGPLKDRFLVAGLLFGIGHGSGGGRQEARGLLPPPMLGHKNRPDRAAGPGNPARRPRCPGRR